MMHPDLKLGLMGLRERGNCKTVGKMETGKKIIRQA